VHVEVREVVGRDGHREANGSPPGATARG
jgi:hypothetical protein